MGNCTRPKHLDDLIDIVRRWVESACTWATIGLYILCDVTYARIMLRNRRRLPLLFVRSVGFRLISWMHEAAT